MARAVVGVVALLALGSGAALLAPAGQTPLEFADTPPPPDTEERVWPLRGRVTVTEPGGDGEEHEVYEFAANRWDDWLLVRLGVAHGEAPLSGPIHAVRYEGGETSVATFELEDLGGPFDTLEDAPSEEFEPVDRDDGQLPIPPLRDVVGAPEMDAGAVLHELAERRVEVADRLGIDVDLLDSAQLDLGGDQPAELVWLANTDVVLARSDEQASVEMTSLETGIGLPEASDDTSRITRPDWQLHRIEERGFEIQYPDGWRHAPQDLIPDLTDPREVVTVSDGEMPAGSDQGCPVPAEAMQSIADDGVLVTVQHAGPVDRFPADELSDKPEPFRLEDGTSNVPHIDCGRDDATTVWFAFQTDGHAVYALMTLGQQAGDEQVDQALAVLDSFRVVDRDRLPEPDGSATEAPTECTGGPADPPACDPDHALPEEEQP